MGPKLRAVYSNILPTMLRGDDPFDTAKGQPDVDAFQVAVQQEYDEYTEQFLSVRALLLSLIRDVPTILRSLFSPAKPKAGYRPVGRSRPKKTEAKTGVGADRNSRIWSLTAAVRAGISSAAASKVHC